MTTRHEFVVYLSSTLADLEPERDVALKAIAEFGGAKTSFRASEEGVVMTCTGDVRKCDLYIGILGQRYGYVPFESNEDEKSITELEYDACRAPGQSPIPRLMFIKPTEAGIAAAHIDALSNPKSAERMKAFLARASEDQTSYSFKKLDDLRSQLSIRVKEKADKFHQVQLGTSAVLRWPGAQDFSTYLTAKREGFVGREWLFRKIIAWATSGTSRSLLITGDPGLGKSAIIAEMVERREKMGVIAWFCCRWEQPDQLAPRVFVEAIAALLAKTVPSYAQALATPELQTVLEDAQTRREIGPRTLFERLVLSALDKLPVPPSECRLILIDALDESLVVPEGVVDLLAATLDQWPKWLRVVATTRAYPDVLRRLHEMQAEVLRAAAAENRADLEDYVAGRLGLSSSSSGDLIYVLDAAQGNFLIAKTLIDEIRKGHLRVAEILKVNTDRAHPLLPPGLQLYYERSFVRLFAAASNFAPAGTVLALAMAALEPLDLPTLRAATGLERTVLASVLKRLASFLPRRSDERFAFFHKSVRDWLDAGTIDAYYGEPIAGRFAIDIRVGQTALADWTLQASQLGGLKAPDYVLRHGVTHLKELGDTEQLRSLLFDFGWLSAKLARIGIQAVLEDFEHLPSALAQERAFQVLRRTLQVKAPILAQFPEQLAPQLLGRLSEASGPEIASLCRTARNWRGRTWLCPLVAQLEPAVSSRVIEGHNEAVTSVAFSSDDTRIALESRNETLRFWYAMSPQDIRASRQGHERWVWSVAFSPNGTRIVSGSEDKTLRLWDAVSGQPVGAPFQGHEGWIWSVAFSPDGTRIVSGSSDKTLRLWDVNNHQSIGAPLRGHENSVSSVAFSPDGKRIVSGSSDNTLRFWDAMTGQPIGNPLQGHEQWVWSVAFSPDGTRVVSGSRDKTLRLWDAINRQPCGTPLQGHEDSVTSVAFSPDGTRIVSGSLDRTLRLWDAMSHEPFGTPLQRHSSYVRSVAFSHDSMRIVSGSDDKTLRLWDLESGEVLSVIEPDAAVLTVAWHDDHIASGESNGAVQVFRVIESNDPLS